MKSLPLFLVEGEDEGEGRENRRYSKPKCRVRAGRGVHFPMGERRFTNAPDLAYVNAYGGRAGVPEADDRLFATRGDSSAK